MIAACSPFSEMDVHGKKLRDGKPVALAKSDVMGHLEVKREGEKEERRKKLEEAEERQRAQRQKSASIMMQFLRKVG